MGTDNGDSFLGIDEVIEKTHHRYGKDEVIRFFESGELRGRKNNGEWRTSGADFEEFFNKKVKELAHFVEGIEVDLSDTDLKGTILDIGGGGEGVIGKLAGKSVIAIDLHKSELEEAGCECVKIVMDATDMKFTDEVFDAATAFFTFMYMDRKDQEKTLKEIFRVMRNGGELEIWDLKIPENPDGDKSIYAATMEINLGRRRISAGYGTSWDKTQDMESICSAAIKCGFDPIDKDEQEHTFHLRFRKRK